MLFESWTLDITDYCFFNKLAFWQSKLLRLPNEHLAVSSINHCLTDSPSTVETTTQHISLDPKMSNRPFSFDSKVQAEEPVVMGLFSKAAAPSCCEPSQSRVDPRLQNVSDAIDEALLNIASEGFVLSATETEIPEVLKEIRRTGCLEAAPLEDQPKLSVDCVLPRPVFCDSQKVWSCGKVRAQSAKVAPSAAAWASLGGAKYDFVDGRK